MAPHELQKDAVGGALAPQEGHTRSRAAPQPAQKRATASFSNPQLEQFILLRMVRHRMRLTPENTAVVLDTASDLPPGIQRRPNWRVVPLTLSFGDETFRDYVDLTPTELYRRLRSSREMPKTSVPAPAEFSAVYAELGGYARILGVHVSSRLSGTYNSASLAADDTGGRVVTIDSGTVSGTVVLLADAIQRRLERGTSDEEVLTLVERFRRSGRFVYTLETLEYLARGGRIGRAKSLASGALNTRPVIQVVDGVNVPVRRLRGRARSLDELERQLDAGSADSPTLHFGITHADAAAEAAELEQRFRRLRPQASFDLLVEFAPALGSHVGPGAVGVFWFDDA